MVRKANIVRTKSDIDYSYLTIKITKSRLDKGLIALPASLRNLFPKSNRDIKIYYGNDSLPINKRFSAYHSSTREARIGGMKEWYANNRINEDDEIVIQVLDKEKYHYRIISERHFISSIISLREQLDNAESKEEAQSKLSLITDITNEKLKSTAVKELSRVAKNENIKLRKKIKRKSTKVGESINQSLRVLFDEVYKGHCQICDFWFLKKDGNPYFEIHHLNPQFGHHPKNILVVCGNCHNQFEHSYVRNMYNNDGWLINVEFNKRKYKVKQALLEHDISLAYKEMHIC